MRKKGSVALVVAMAMLAAGCGHRGFDRGKGPDEFAVARQAPLVIPPDFALVPPTTGTARPQDTATNAQTLDALFGGQTRRTAGEAALVEGAGGNQAETGIRSTVGDPQTTVVDKGSTTRDIVAAPQGDGQDARAAVPQ